MPLPKAYLDSEFPFHWFHLLFRLRHPQVASIGGIKVDSDMLHIWGPRTIFVIEFLILNHNTFVVPDH